MDLAIGRGEWERERGAFPPWRQENCFLEPSKTDAKGYNILSRPPMEQAYAWGSGAVEGPFSTPGLFGGAIFAIIGGQLYKDGVALGAIAGTGPASWAAGTDELVVTRGADAYSYDGTTLAAIAFPDGADVAAVNWMARRFIYVRAGSGRFYWSALDDGRTVDGFNYANSESEQDELLDIKKTGDVFWMLGSHSGEAWVLTGDPDLPWSKVSQRTINRGVAATGCAVEIEGSVFFISNDRLICTIQDAAIRISDAALEEKLRASTNLRAFGFQLEGRPIFCARLDTETYALDLSMQNQPVLLSTQGRSNWAAQGACDIDGQPLFADDTDGILWRFNEGAQTDAGAAEMHRVFSAGAPGNAMRVANIIVNGNTGSTPATVGANADPMLEMRYSRDGGRTFAPWRSSRWGRQGDYRRQARFGSCGQFQSPGFLAEFRMLACAPLRVSAVRANEKLAGRGRA